MKSKIEPILLAVFVSTFVVVTICLFIPRFPVLPIYSLYLTIILGMMAIRKSPIGFMMVAFATLLGVFLLSRIPEGDKMIIPLLILSMWGSSFMVYVHNDRYRRKAHDRLKNEDDVNRQIKLLKKEIAFYDSKKADVFQRATQRKKLAQAARELGSVLDPHDLQEKLIQIASSLFPNQPVTVSYGQNPDALEKYIIQRKQPILVPGDLFKGNPLMAVPIVAQRTVAGILKVGGHPGALAYSREDLRLLDILASLASLALDNSLLFTQVQDTALRDNLTGLLTHKAFQDYLDNALLEASRYHQNVSLILTDVDHFKSVNDMHGHQAGDQILQGFAHVMARNVREIDILARWGGEEFIVLLWQTPHEEALRIAENIRVDLESQRFEAGNQILNITGSFGVATFPDDAASAQQLIRFADQRMYAAKKGGRNQVHGKAA